MAKTATKKTTGAVKTGVPKSRVGVQKKKTTVVADKSAASKPLVARRKPKTVEKTVADAVAKAVAKAVSKANAAIAAKEKAREKKALLADKKKHKKKTSAPSYSVAKIQPIISELIDEF